MPGQPAAEKTISFRGREDEIAFRFPCEQGGFGLTGEAHSQAGGITGGNLAASNLRKENDHERHQ